MLRNESLVHDNVLAASPRQPADKPIIFELDIADRQQKKRSARVGYRRVQR